MGRNQPGQQFTLVEAPFAEPGRVQGNGNQQVNVRNRESGAADQVRQQTGKGAAQGGAASVFEQVNQVTGCVVVNQGRPAAVKGEAVPGTVPAHNDVARTGGASTAAAERRVIAGQAGQAVCAEKFRGLSGRQEAAAEQTFAGVNEIKQSVNPGTDTVESHCHYSRSQQRFWQERK